MADLEVVIVTVEREFWSGTASMVVAKTTEGEIGIQRGHEPLLGQLDATGTVSVYTDEGKRVASVRGGFISVTASKVQVLGEGADWAENIDKAAAERILADSGSSELQRDTARSRILAVEKAGA